MDNATPAPPRNKGGRPEGSLNKLAREAREKAARTGLLPHEIMLDIARGNPQTEQLVDPVTKKVTKTTVAVSLDMRLDAAKAAAPYYAPKISTVELLAGANENELDRLIEVLAAEAGVDLGTRSKSEDSAATAERGGDGAGSSTEHGTGLSTILRRRPVTST
jgi:hypothetical protein